MSTSTEARSAAEAAGEITRGMRDGVEVHKAALQAGLNTRLLPRQVLQVYGRGGVKTSFTHGIPQASTLSGVTFTQDLRMRRGLLGKAGIPQPRGATFSIGKARPSIRRYAEKLGYPVVVKPSLGDSTIDVMRGIRNRHELDSALNTLMTPPEEREDSTQAAYGITELRKPGWENGRVTVPPGYRVLVEEELRGDYLRLLIVDRKVVSVVRCSQDPWGAGNEGVPVNDLDPEVLAIAENVVTALPGLSLLSLDVVTLPEADEEGVRVKAVDVSERPWLEVQHRISPALSNKLAHRILQHGVKPAKAEEPRMSTLSVDVDFEGVVSPKEFVAALSAYASQQELGLGLDIRNNALGYVGGRLEGTPQRIAELVEVVLDRGVDGQSAMKAEITQ